MANGIRPSHKNNLVHFESKRNLANQNIVDVMVED